VRGVIVGVTAPGNCFIRREADYQMRNTKNDVFFHPNDSIKLPNGSPLSFINIQNDAKLRNSLLEATVVFNVCEARKSWKYQTQACNVRIERSKNGVDLESIVDGRWYDGIIAKDQLGTLVDSPDRDGQWGFVQMDKPDEWHRSRGSKKEKCYIHVAPEREVGGVYDANWQRWDYLPPKGTRLRCNLIQNPRFPHKRSVQWAQVVGGVSSISSSSSSAQSYNYDHINYPPLAAPPPPAASAPAAAGRPPPSRRVVTLAGRSWADIEEGEDEDQTQEGDEENEEGGDGN